MKTEQEVERQPSTDVKVAAMDVATVFVLGSAAVIGLLVIGLSPLFATL